MNPSYFNPATPTSNFIGTNPLENYTPPETPSHMEPAYFNPSLFDPFTFSGMSQQPFFHTYTAPYGIPSTSSIAGPTTSIPIGHHQSGNYSYLTTVENHFTTWYNTQTYVYDTIYAPNANGAPVTFGSRFGTGTQKIYYTAQSYSETTVTVVDVTLETVDAFSTVVSTYYSPTGSSPWGSIGQTDSPTTASTFGIFDSYSTLPIPPTSTLTTGTTFSVSSMFVEMLGSNVYQGLLGASNSIIIYQNEQVSSYYSESLSYQVNITNLTAALNSVAQTTDAYGVGAGMITVTNFAWVWTSSPGIGWTGTQLTDTIPGTFTYTFQETASQYLAENYNLTIQNSSVAVSVVQEQLTTENNYLSTAQTFLNNAVTTLQSQTSLTGQIIASLAAMSASITTNIASA